MFGLENISIDFLSGTIYLVIPVTIFLIGLSVYLYFKTNPPLNKYLRALFITLRITAVLTLMAALSEPVISYTRNFDRPVKVSLLLDESLSMDEIEQGKSRRSRRDSLLSSSVYENFRGKVDINVYYFGSNLSDKSDEIDRGSTALGDIIKQLESREIGNRADHWILMSDGNSNFGSNPGKIASDLPTPVAAVNLAEKDIGFDIALDEVEFNPVVFAGQPTKIKVKLSWLNMERRNLDLRLSDSSKIIGNGQFLINQGEGLGEVEIDYTPGQPGLKILNISFPVIEDEENVENNRRSFTVKVLKSRLKILLAAHAPDYEVGFLNRYLSSSDKYDVDLKITGPNSGNLGSPFPNRQTELNRYDLVILYDPTISALAGKQNLLESYVSEKGGALWFMLGENISVGDFPEWLKKLLPFSPQKINKMYRQSAHAVPVESQLYHPSVRLGDSHNAIRKSWSETPPFRQILPCRYLNPEGVILAEAALGSHDNNRLPVIGYRRYGSGKVFTLAALPLWPWHFIPIGLEEDNSTYRKFIEGTVGWLTVDDDQEPIRIAPDKNIYNRGEEVVFNGYAYDIGFRPLPDVSGKITMTTTDNSSSYEIDLSMIEEGIYRGAYNNLPPGEYNYKALFNKDGRVLKEVTGKILVESFSVEEYDLTGDPALLQSISDQSGGSYYTVDRFDEALNSISIDPISVSEKKDISLWNKIWMLLIFIGTLVVEWLLRKMNQLI